MILFIESATALLMWAAGVLSLVISLNAAQKRPEPEEFVNGTALWGYKLIVTGCVLMLGTLYVQAYMRAAAC